MAEPLRHSRRGVLAGLTAGAGSLIAGTAFAGRASASDAAQPVLLTVTGSSFTVVHGSLMRPQRGERALVTGVLHDGKGRQVGTFHADVAVLINAERHQVSTQSALEHHHLTLPGGTLTSSGVVSHSGKGTFAVTGGTGAYAGSRGSYEITQDRRGQGGDGSALLTIHLLP